MFGGFSLVIGALALSASGLRRGAMTRYALAPVLRLARLRRFPVVPFLLAWALVASTLDGGGYHDIRRLDADPGLPQAPTIAKALNDFVGAQPSGAARPVVLVGASGGGIRAAVWTALVMECLFGPGPVQGTNSLCAKGSGTPSPSALTTEAAKPLPVFIASGASGVVIEPESKDELAFGEALDALLRQLALLMVRDGEGAARVGRVVVRGGHLPNAEAAARAVANSPLVKCALNGGDPNWGRIAQAVGAALPGAAPLPLDIAIEEGGQAARNLVAILAL